MQKEKPESTIRKKDRGQFLLIRAYDIVDIFSITHRQAKNIKAPQITQTQLKHRQPLEALERMQALVTAIAQAIDAKDYPKASTPLPQITESLPAFKKQSELYRWALGPLQREMVALSWTHSNEVTR